jgi:simple sugar transport system ATP-binding protein
VIEARSKGTAVLLVSAELDEVMSLSDRIAVLVKGRVVATFDAAAVNAQQLGLLMAGGTAPDAPSRAQSSPDGD